MQTLSLRKGAERRLSSGHCWVYSNEVDVAKTPLKSFVAGDLVEVVSAAGKILGSAYMEPNSLICARIYSPQAGCELNEALVTERINSALKLRQQFYSEPYYRLLFGDSDSLSGVVVDRYGDYLVVQLNTAGIERYQGIIVDALVSVLSPKGVLLRGDSRARKEQNLGSQSGLVFGEVPERVELIENGVKFLVPVFDGQKTGWFYDHRSSRGRLQDYVKDKRVLDVFSYIGGWGIQACAFGASEACFVDSSQTALDGVLDNARLHQWQDRVEVLKGSADKALAMLVEQGRHFDVVIVDPPAFIQRKKDIKQGMKAYQRINEAALKLLDDGGTLISASCSMHLSAADLRKVVNSAAQRVGVSVRILEQGHQAMDHPIHPAIPETEYIKTWCVAVSR